jgi:hypothetical protein
VSDENLKKILANLANSPQLERVRPERMISWSLELPVHLELPFKHIALDNHGGIYILMKSPAVMSLAVDHSDLMAVPFAVGEGQAVRLELHPLVKVKR